MGNLLEYLKKGKGEHLDDDIAKAVGLPLGEVRAQHSLFDSLGNGPLEGDRGGIGDRRSDAAADHARGLRVKRTRRNQVQNIFLILHDNRVPRVGATLTARNDIRVRCQQVNNLPFSFIPPLGAYQDIEGHTCLRGSDVKLRQCIFNQTSR